MQHVLNRRHLLGLRRGGILNGLQAAKLTGDDALPLFRRRLRLLPVRPDQRDQQQRRKHQKSRQTGPVPRPLLPFFRPLFGKLKGERRGVVQQAEGRAEAGKRVRRPGPAGGNQRERLDIRRRQRPLGFAIHVACGRNDAAENKQAAAH